MRRKLKNVDDAGEETSLAARADKNTAGNGLTPPCDHTSKTHAHKPSSRSLSCD